MRPWWRKLGGIEMPPQRCVCGHPCDMASPLPGSTSRGDRPRDDGSSLTVCIACGRAYRFGPDFQLEPLDVDTLDDPHIRAVIRRAQAAIVLLSRKPS
jgi:hypothetical protein